MHSLNAERHAGLTLRLRLQLVVRDSPPRRVMTMPSAISRTLPGAAGLMDLPGHGPTAYWDCPGPEDAPTLVLLHGVTLTAEVNWSAVAPWLTEHYRVIAVDRSGRGRGWTSSLEEYADDVAELLDNLGIEQAIPVGFSMGGLVAQSLWHRHRRLVAGLVLCSTSRNVSGSLWDHSLAQLLPATVAAAAWVPGMHLLGADVLAAGLLDTPVEPEKRRWVLTQMRRTPLLTALTTARAACEFSSHSWIGSVDVPAAVVLTRRDRVVPPRRQWKLAQAIPGCSVHEIDGGHSAFLDDPDAFAAALLDACAAVSSAADQEPTEIAS